MAVRIVTISRAINGSTVDQRQADGYVNATQLCKAHREKTGERKDPSDWLKTQTAQSALGKLSTITNIPVIKLVEQRTGRYGGTWIHPRLAVRFAMWLNDDFSLQVEDWVHEWMSSGYNPIQLEADTDRVNMRDELKDSKRLEFTGQIKTFLETAGKYDPRSKETRIFFGRAHNKLNIVLTTETADAMRRRLEVHLGKKVSESELLRDYFPITDLANYAALCQAAANEMAVNRTYPLTAIDIATKQVLSQNYVARPIDFTERIELVRRRLEQRDQLLLLGR